MHEAKKQMNTIAKSRGFFSGLHRRRAASFVFVGTPSPEEQGQEQEGPCACRFALKLPVLEAERRGRATDAEPEEVEHKVPCQRTVGPLARGTLVRLRDGKGAR